MIYDCEDGMTGFLRNVWHMVAWCDEIGQDLMSRRVCGQSLLIFRRVDGSAVVMDDRCPHRFAPLSLGNRDGDRVACGYHGLVFDAEGHCVGNPFSPKIPSGAAVRTYPVIEQDSIVWVWMGSAADADQSLIADLPFLRDLPEERLLRGYTRMRANYEYGTDNLMDLSHIEFVHKGSFAGAGVIFAGSHEVIEEGATLHSNWWMPDVAAPGHTTGIYPPNMRTDHWLDMRWNAPATMQLTVGATPLGGPRADGVVVEQAHVLTAETQDTTHYFWATSATFPLADDEATAGFKALFAKAFDEEDKPMIEAAYANLEGADFWDARPVFLGIDAGGTRARRILQKMRRLELQSTPAMSHDAGFGECPPGVGVSPHC